MRKLAAAALFAFTINAHAATPIEFDFRSINVGQVVQLAYGDALKAPYVIDPEVLADPRMVSFRYRSEQGDVKRFLSKFLDSLGYSTTTRDGVDYIKKKPEQKPDEEDKDVFIYRPNYREVSELSNLLGPLFKGSFTVNRGISNPTAVKSDTPVPEGSAASLTDQKLDVLVFSGAPKEVAMLKKLLPQVDTKTGEVVVQAAVYEVTTNTTDGSAFSLALNLLGSKFTLALSPASPLDSFVRFKSHALDAVFSALSTDSRFNVVSTPSLRVQSGKIGRFTVGQDVPVLGSVSYQNNGQAVQSVEYKSSGVIFEIAPTVREKTIELTLDQQLSNFVQTTTGVNNSPTLTKRQVRTSLTATDGDIIILGGLAETKDTGANNGVSFLPDFLKTKSSTKSKTEILLVLQVKNT